MYDRYFVLSAPGRELWPNDKIDIRRGRKKKLGNVCSWPVQFTQPPGIALGGVGLVNGKLINQSSLNWIVLSKKKIDIQISIR